MADDCIFCAIVEGRAPSHPIAEGPHALAFMDIFPASPGHVLVIPREHSENLFEISPTAVQAVAALSRRVARAMRTALGPDGMAVYQANGVAALQTIFHYHVHLIPRNEGDDFALHGRKRAPDEELQALAARIASELES